MFTPDTCCTLVPYFDVPEENLAAFKALGPKFIAIRTGIRGSDDIAWVGEAPNRAAKLSAVRDDRYRTFITTPCTGC